MGLRIQNAPAPPALCACPTRLSIGSGKSFAPDYLNVDVEPRWQPDILADLNQPFPAGSGRYQTARFGEIEVRPGTFDEIIAFDVLEHIRELTTAMTSCLQLLRVGGVFRIRVPYDLSLGAWCDPTHVRAFNESSWTYYTQWCWYLGWTEHHFRLAALELVPSDHGRALAARGVSTEELQRTPRAIDAMHVELQKAELDAATRQAAAQLLPAGRVH